MNPKIITVLIPTANRPKFLLNALQSVALQSRKDIIAKVLVSENSSNKESKHIALGFADIFDVDWYFQEQPLTPQEHGIWLSKQVVTPWIAQLADDDMWSAYHLEDALKYINLSNVCAYFGQAACVVDNSCQIVSRFSWNYSSQDLINSPGLIDINIWNQQLVAINSLSSTPLNIWAAVVKSSVHRDALLKSAGDPRFGRFPSNDALYIWELSNYGKIAVSRNISIFYRVHSMSDIVTARSRSRWKTFAQDLLIRLEIVNRASCAGINPVSAWRKNYGNSKLKKNHIFVSKFHKAWLLSSSLIKRKTLLVCFHMLLLFTGLRDFRYLFRFISR